MRPQNPSTCLGRDQLGPGPDRDSIHLDPEMSTPFAPQTTMQSVPRKPLGPCNAMRNAVHTSHKHVASVGMLVPDKYPHATPVGRLMIMTSKIAQHQPWGSTPPSGTCPFAAFSFFPLGTRPLHPTPTKHEPFVCGDMNALVAHIIGDEPDSHRSQDFRYNTQGMHNGGDRTRRDRRRYPK